MEGFEIAALASQQAGSANAYLEFIRHPSLSVGLYVLKVGAVDRQQPHSEDEVYYVVQGRGMFQQAGEERPVQAGSVLYVAAGGEHRFHTITEEMQIIVFFAPAEYSQRPTRT